MPRREQKEVFVLSGKEKVPDLEELLTQRYWIRFKIQSKIEGHVDADEMFQTAEIVSPDQLTQLKLEALEHRQDEIMAKLLEMSKKLERKSKPSLSEVSLEHLRNSFSRIGLVKGIYAHSTQDGYEVVITYPESERLGEVLKKLVPIEVELTRKYKDIPIEFEYLPTSDFSSEMKSTFKVLFELKGQHLNAE